MSKPKLYDYNHNLIAVLDNAYNINYIPNYGGLKELSFTYPKFTTIKGQLEEDPRFELIKNEYIVEYKDSYFIIKEPQVAVDNSENTVLEVLCDDMAIELSRKKVQYVSMNPSENNGSVSTASEAITNVLDSIPTDWTLGTVDSSFDGIYRAFVFEWQYATDCLRQIQEKFGGFLEFKVTWDNGWVKQVNLNNTLIDEGLQFAYSKNLKSLRVIPNTDKIITRLWCYGYGNVSINDIATETRTDNGVTYNKHTNGQSYIDNFQYFLLNGLATTYQECLDRFIYEDKFSSDEYVDAQTLYDDAVKELEKRSKPEIRYEIDILDLAELTGYDYEEIKEGQIVTIIYPSLGVKVNTHITNINRNSESPWNTTVELESIKEDIADIQLKAIRNANILADNKFPKLNQQFLDLADDGKITPAEKLDVKKEWEIIQSEYTLNINRATTYGVDYSTYQVAYNSLNSFITPILSDMNATSSVNRTNYNTFFNLYYDERTKLLGTLPEVYAQDEADVAYSQAVSDANDYTDSQVANIDLSSYAPKVSPDGLVEISPTKGFISYVDSSKEEFAQLYGGGVYRVNVDTSTGIETKKEYFYERYAAIIGTRQLKNYPQWDVPESTYMADLNPIYTIQLPDSFKGKDFKIFPEIYLGDGSAILDMAFYSGDTRSDNFGVVEIMTEDESQIWDGLTKETMPSSIKTNARFKVKCLLYWEFGFSGGGGTIVTRERVKIDAMV